jgi:hypothetical protein
MLSTNPFSGLAGFVPVEFMQWYVGLMAVLVVAGTVFDVHHKGSGIYFAQRREKYRARATRQLGSGEKMGLLFATIAEAAVSGEFDKTLRRISHLLMMYGFILYIVTTILMLTVYKESTPPILPTLWTLGAALNLLGALWFFFFLRADLVHDGVRPWQLRRADLFVGSLILSMAFALLWHFVLTSGGDTLAARVLFWLYIGFSTLLFAGVPWSKFAHMFFKPAVAYQRRIEEADGSSDLPSPSTQNFIVRT